MCINFVWQGDGSIMWSMALVDPLVKLQKYKKEENLLHSTPLRKSFYRLFLWALFFSRGCITVCFKFHVIFLSCWHFPILTKKILSRERILIFLHEDARPWLSRLAENVAVMQKHTDRNCSLQLGCIILEISMTIVVMVRLSSRRGWVKPNQAWNVKNTGIKLFNSINQLLFNNFRYFIRIGKEIVCSSPIPITDMFNVLSPKLKSFVQSSSGVLLGV